MLILLIFHGELGNWRHAPCVRTSEQPQIGLSLSQAPLDFPLKIPKVLLLDRYIMPLDGLRQRHLRGITLEYSAHEWR